MPTNSPARSSAALVGVAGLLSVLVLPPGVAAATPSDEASAEATTIRVVATDAEIEPAYWRSGPGATAIIVITVSNNGVTAADIRGSYTVPPGARRTGVTAADGCATLASQGLRCTLAPAAAATVTLKLALDSDGWRKAPLTGLVTVSAGTFTDTDSYSLLLPPGPPAPGAATAAEDVTLAFRSLPRPESVPLVTRLSNTGPVAAAGAVEVVTPAGVDLVTFPPACVSHRPITATRDRCEVGVVGPGEDVALIFGLLVPPPARADAPLAGATYGFLVPAGREALTVVATYRLVVSATAPSPEPTATPAAAAPITTAEAPDRAVVVRTVGIFSRPLDTIAIVSSVIGLFVLAGIIGVLSLRRRLQDDNDLPSVVPPSSGLS